MSRHVCEAVPFDTHSRSTYMHETVPVDAHCRWTCMCVRLSPLMHVADEHTCMWDCPGWHTWASWHMRLSHLTHISGHLTWHCPIWDLWQVSRHVSLSHLTHIASRLQHNQWNGDRQTVICGQCRWGEGGGRYPLWYFAIALCVWFSDQPVSCTVLMLCLVRMGILAFVLAGLVLHLKLV